MLVPTLLTAGPDRPTKFSNRNGVANTRHNLTQRPPDQSGGVINASLMDTQRNDYDEVCVYCHTPHQANRQVAAPLWNRTAPTLDYTRYAPSPGSTLTAADVTDPGPNSLTCLSCHDGSVGIDSIINMPNVSPWTGQPSANYDVSQETGQNNGFLNSWGNPQQNVSHVSMGDQTGQLTGNDSAVGCMACHSNTPFGNSIGGNATDFAAFLISKDLTNDHPIGVRFPTAPGADFNAPSGVLAGRALFYDGDGDGRPDPEEIRLYDTGEGPEVECASCHDPHGVPSAGPGSQHYRSFLRVDNSRSGVCLTCHAK
ncbi:MAG: hypothetical protein H6983_10600 [Ectothiorhodospiraceae bacterium]|nr:hypothetical protein [Chromatiales bacterium]MCP5154606.1 hypothetical protein [Ectothiorhodospiraceae bacterium]